MLLKELCAYYSSPLIKTILIRPERNCCQDVGIICFAVEFPYFHIKIPAHCDKYPPSHYVDMDNKLAGPRFWVGIPNSWPWDHLLKMLIV